MLDRKLKALFSLMLGGLALFYVAHNFANIGPAYDFFTYVTSHVDQESYPVTLLPVPPSPLIVVAMVLVFALEAAAAFFLIWGAWKMWKTCAKDAAAFEAAKNLSKIGIGCAVLNWWGLFQVVAVAGYQLWQMPLGEGPYYGSFFFGAMNMAVLVYLNQKD